MFWYKILLSFYLCLRITVNYILIPSPYSKCTPNIKKALVVSPTVATFYFYCTCVFSATFSGTFSAIFSGTFSGTRWTWLAFAPRLAGTFSGTFSGTFLNLTWLLHQSLRNLPRNWLCTKASQASPEPSPEPDPVEPDPALHQSLPHLLWEPSPEPCWTWPDSAPKPPFSGCWTRLGFCTKASQTFSGSFSGSFSRTCWTWPGSAPKPPRPSFSGTFSRTLLNLSQTFSGTSEPSREPRWTWPGACTSAHLSYSGLKTPLAYAVGEKGIHFQFWETLETY